MTSSYQLDEGTRALAQKLGSSTMHEAAGKTGDLPPRMTALSQSLSVCGPALPVLAPPGDNLWIHRAIYEARPGEVLVVSTQGAFEYGYFGEIMARAAQERGVAGLVIDGCIRDALAIIELGFPVFSTGRCVHGTAKRGTGGAMAVSISLGDVTINRGDIVVGDWDGVVVLPAAKFPAILQDSIARADEERELFARLAAGETTLSLYKF